MKTWQSGISWYVTGEIRGVFVHFPEGEANCRHCDFCRYHEAFSTYSCRLTDEYIDKAALNDRGKACPIHFEDTPF